MENTEGRMKSIILPSRRGKITEKKKKKTGLQDTFSM